MKLSLVILLSCFALCSVNTASAQYSTPRYGTAGNQDNTGRALSYGLITKADTLGSTTDTLTTTLTGTLGSYYHTDMILTLNDSCVLAFSSVKGCHKGDELRVIIENTSGSGHFVNFIGYTVATKWDMSTTGTKISPASGKRATINFVFDGTAWIEENRSTH